MAAPPEFVRRSDFLVAYWRRGGLVIENYVSGVKHAGSAAVIEVLDVLGKWMPTSELVKALSHWEPETVHDSVAELVDLTLLESGSRPPDPRGPALSRWEHPFDKGPASPFIGEIRDNGELQDAGDRTVVPPGRRVLEGAPSSVGAHGRVQLSGQKEGAAP